MATLINWNNQVQPLPGKGYTIPTYGNYGGPGYGDATYTAPPLDNLDALFQAHDQAYGDVYARYAPGADVSTFTVEDRRALAQADKVVLDGILSLSQESTGLPTNDARVYAAATMFAFIEGNIKGRYGAGDILTASEEAAYKAYGYQAGVEGLFYVQDTFADDVVDCWGLHALIIDNAGAAAYDNVLVPLYQRAVEAKDGAVAAAQFMTDLTLGVIDTAVTTTAQLLDAAYQAAARTLDNGVQAAALMAQLTQDLLQAGVATAQDLLARAYVATVEALEDGVRTAGDLAQLTLDFLQAGLGSLEALLSNLHDTVIDHLANFYEATLLLTQLSRELLVRGVDGFQAFVPDVYRDLIELWGTAQETRSPLILDLDGDGVETIGLSSGVFFDHDANNFAELTGWVGADDGLLVWDRDADGQIENGQELFGNYSMGSDWVNPSGTALLTLADSGFYWAGENEAYPDGFTALARLADSNADAVVDAQDALWGELRVWRDLDGDAVTDAGELLTLEQAGVVSLPASESSYVMAGNQVAFTLDAAGNAHLLSGTYGTAAGSAAMDDVWFQANPNVTRDLNVVAVPAAVAALPNLAGAGNVGSLQQEIVRDVSGRLKGLVEGFIATEDPTQWAQLATTIIYAWAGVENVDPESRAATIIYGNAIGDARKLEAMEEFLGRNYYGTWCWGERDPNPHGPASRVLLVAFDKLVEYVKAELLAQTHLKSVLQVITVDALGAGAYEADVRLAVDMLQSRYQQDSEGTMAVMQELAAYLKQQGAAGESALDALQASGEAGTGEFHEVLAGMGLADDRSNALFGGDGADILFGLGGSDTLYGGAGDDTLNGGSGGDFLSGQGGADVYVFSRGTGQDSIHNEDADAPGTRLDTIRVAEGITPDQVVLGRDYFDLLLRIEGTSDEIRVLSHFDPTQGASFAIDRVVFHDDTVWSADFILQRLNQQTEGDDLLTGDAGDDSFDAMGGQDLVYGGGGNDALRGGGGDDIVDAGAGDDVLTGGAGNDMLKGGLGSDTYAFDRGDGRDVIYNFAPAGDEAPGKVDVIRFGADITPDDVVARRYQSDLILALRGSEDSITVGSYFSGPEFQIDEVRFTNDTVWSRAALEELVRHGTEEADWLYGTEAADTLFALGGDDWLQGGDGSDDLQGGAGRDSLVGEQGDDVLDGGDEDDSLDAGTGNDALAGGAGNDVLWGGAGDDQLAGGEGDDNLYDYEGGNTQSGGGGADQFHYVSYGAGTDTLTGGTGRDTYNLYWYTWAENGPDVVTDFAAGDSGDLVNIYSLLYQLAGYNWELNPFTNGYLRLLQVGADSQLQVNLDAADADWQTVLVLQNTTAAQFNSDNFIPSWSPTGIGRTIDGDQDPLNPHDYLQGTLDSDVIHGLDGNDTIYSSSGHDTVQAGSGDDHVPVGAGDDSVEGGDGADYLAGEAGQNTLLGGAGNDYLVGNPGDDVLEGGDDDDTLNDYEGANIQGGGAGNDHFQNVAYSDGADTFSGGAGSDTYHVSWYLWAANAVDRITDFQPGAGGDVLDIGSLFWQFSGYNGELNPFVTGFLRLQQEGPDTNLQLNLDGAGDDWQTVLVLQGIQAANFSSDNFSPAWSPTGTGRIVVGDQDAANLNDVLGGSLDGDSIQALEGDDTVYASSGDDTVQAGPGQDYVAAGAGSDSVDGGEGSDNLAGESGHDTLIGGAGGDYLAGHSGNDVLDGGDDDDTLNDYEGANSQGGGAGNDHFQNVAYSDGADTFSGGAGSDTYHVNWYQWTINAADRITDFQAGAGGDVLDLTSIYWQFSGYNGELNPFTSGFLRLRQEAADTLLQLNLDGGGDDWQTLLVLESTIAASLVSDNFAPAWSPTGTGRIIVGDQDAANLNDTLGGSLDSDSIQGLEGDDIFYASSGNDTVQGGAGNDYVYAGPGSDSVEGGEGGDNLYGDSGADVLQGGAGSDYLAGHSGDDVLLGGDDDDTLNDSEGANVLGGGAGDDEFHNVAYSDGADTLTGGTGSDVYRIGWYQWYANAVDTITDFQAGAGGDVLDIGYLFWQFSGYDGALNPFMTGFLRLQQQAADTLLQLNLDGTGDDWQTVVVLQGTTAADLTADNFSPGWSPTGVGRTIAGDQDAANLNDTLYGSLDRDSIQGLDGDDVIYASTGDDTVQGGTGNDYLPAGAGNDSVEGGEGDDNLTGEAGHDTLVAGAGNDYLTGNAGDDVLDGGDDSDTFNDYEGANVLTGGAGDDQFQNVAHSDGADTLTGGTGSDVYRIGWYQWYANAVDTITDFQAGAGGDVLDIGYLFWQFSGYDGALNPFMTGYLRLQQEGADTLLQLDLDAAGGDWLTVVVLQGTVAGDLVADNFSPGWSPAAVGLTIVGDQDPDNLNDTLYGSLDGDSILGLDGDDVIYPSSGNDTVQAGSGADYVAAGAGDDSVDGGDGHDNLSGEAGQDTLAAGAGNDYLAGNAGDDVLDGGDGDDTLNDYEGANALAGGAGNDVFQNVAYSDGADTLTGGGGSDRYQIGWYQWYANAVDTITDFQGGAGGDVLDIGGLFWQFSGYNSELNPFRSGYLRLQQEASDTHLQLNLDGAGDDWQTVVVLQGTTALDLTAENFSPAWAPADDGTYKLVVGDQDPANLNDTLYGSLDADSISGLEGDDQLYGLSGNDILLAGPGNDYVAGAAGDDSIEGGDGADNLSGEAGQDTLAAGAGNDYLAGNAGDDVLDGGDDDDSLNDYEGANALAGGAGNDLFQNVAYSDGADTLTGGGGSDRYQIGWYQWDANAVDTITDFQGGAGGDVLDIGGLFWQFSGYNSELNPFRSGYLRLQQEASDTHLQLNLDGAGDDWQTVVVLQGTNAITLTADNFSPSWSPVGFGRTIFGDQNPENLNDTLYGSLDGDDIHALKGDDTVYPSSGNDTVQAGTGHDYVAAGVGDDLVEGGDGSDTLYGEAGQDSLSAGAGNDSLAGNAGDDVLAGGDDDDVLDDYEGANAMDGGAGNDIFQNVAYSGGADTLTGGTGSDSYRISWYQWYSNAVDTITDFQPGAGGDVLEISGLFWQFSGYVANTNPFRTGYLRLLQDGTDAHLQLNLDASGDDWQSVVVLQGTLATDLTLDNFQPAWEPRQDTSVIVGTDLDDTLYGSLDADSILGLEGHDTVYGNTGSDTVDGGNGDDVLRGQDGDDVLLGGGGNDYLAGDGGSDSLEGGDGDDTFEDTDGGNVMAGGAGSDHFQNVSGSWSTDILSGGADRDTYHLGWHVWSGTPADVVTDFQAGAGGDVVDISSLQSQFSWYYGYSYDNNPFRSGFLRLQQAGADTSLV